MNTYTYTPYKPPCKNVRMGRFGEVDSFRAFPYDQHMASDFTINTREIDRYAAHLKGMKASTLHVAHRMLLNNMAFAVRKEVLEYIPRVMVVRNKRFLASTIRVAKARSGTDMALLYQQSRARYGGLREQEFGGVLGRQASTLAARGKNKAKQMQKKARLMGKILKPEDISLTGEKSYNHRVHVFLEMLQRKTAFIGAYKGAFILPRSKGFKGGLVKLGKIAKRKQGMRKRADTRPRKITTLQEFTKGKQRVRKTKWMRPSIDKYLRRADATLEWRKVMRLLISRSRSFK